MNVQLKTDRLILRRPAPKDAERMTAFMQNFHVVSMLAVPPWPYKRSDADDYIARVQQPGEKGGYSFAITFRDGDERDLYLGNVSLFQRTEPYVSKDWEVGYWLGQPYWRQGIMREALGAVLAFGFETVKLDKIMAGYFVDNIPSAALLQQMGFTKVEQNKMMCVARGHEVDHVATQCSAKQWRAAKNRI